MAGYPRPESRGGWPGLRTSADARSIAGMDDARLDAIAEEEQLVHGGDSWGLVIIRHGYLVREYYTFNVSPSTRFGVFSCTKTFTGTAWGVLLDDIAAGRVPGAPEGFHLDSPVYRHIPEGEPLSDARKRFITLRHLLSMTSGIRGEDTGVRGIPDSTTSGPYEYALGHSPNRLGQSAAELAADPGTCWDYSDAAFAHLSILFEHVAGVEMRDFLRERVLAPIGLEESSWGIQGGAGFIGPHTNAHTGMHISARELARFGYLALRRGEWDGVQLVPAEWMDLATRSSQKLNPDYGLSWWTNAAGSQWPGIPTDAFGLAGYRANRCYVIPSLDLVVARVGTGPTDWNEGALLRAVAGAIVG